MQRVEIDARPRIKPLFLICRLNSILHYQNLITVKSGPVRAAPAGRLSWLSHPLSRRNSGYCPAWLLIPVQPRNINQGSQKNSPTSMSANRAYCIRQASRQAAARFVKWRYIRHGWIRRSANSDSIMFSSRFTATTNAAVQGLNNHATHSFLFPSQDSWLHARAEQAHHFSCCEMWLHAG